VEWFENTEFWELTYPFMFPETRIEKAEEDILSILQLTGRNECDVLDLCCGPGRFSIPLARMGFNVTGVDSTHFLLSIAGNRASIEGVHIEWIEEDMRRFKKQDSFDLALNMFTSFGYFTEHSDNMKVLSNVRDSLRGNGRFVLEVMGKETLASIFHSVTDEENEEGQLLIQRHRIIDDWSRIENDWLLIENDDIIARWNFSHWVYSASELTDMLLKAGFLNVDIYGSLDGAEYDSNSSRLIAVATA